MAHSLAGCEARIALTLAEVVARFDVVRRHLGRRRPFWEFLIDGWRSDGLLQITHPGFRRLLVECDREATLVDLVIDRAPSVDAPVTVGRIVIDSMREIAANKICALLGRGESRDLVDLKYLFDHGITLESALADAARKDAGADAATLAWLLDQLSIAPDARVPGDIGANELERFRVDLVRRLRRLALPGGDREP